MDPVFEIQMKSLKSFCGGKKDRLCNAGKYCGRNDCNRAHSADECIDGFYQALVAVDNMVESQIKLHKHHSKILMSLEANNAKKKYKQNNRSNRNNHGHHGNRNRNYGGNFHSHAHSQSRHLNRVDLDHNDWRRISHNNNYDNNGTQ